MLKLQGKNVLVTGASSGIGQAIAIRFAEEGANVAINYRSGAEQAEFTKCAALKANPKGNHITVQADVSKEAEVESMFSSVLQSFGSLEVLVNNAGIQKPMSSHEINIDDFDRVLGVNLRGLLLVSRESIPLLRESKGWIFNLASIAGTAPTPGLTVYGATKAAVIALTRSQNPELEAAGVRAVAICPGFVDTAMAEWSGLATEEMITTEDCAEVVRMCLRLSPNARIPQVVIERVGQHDLVG